MLLLYILIVVLLIVFLAATITLIARQFAKKISLEGYTEVPQQFTPSITTPSSKQFTISGAALHNKLSQLPINSYRPPIGAILSFPFLNPNETVVTINGVVYAVCNGQKLYNSQVAKQLQSSQNSSNTTITVPDLRNKTLKQLDKDVAANTQQITVFPYGSKRTDAKSASITKLPSSSTSINSNKLLSYQSQSTAKISTVTDDHQNVVFAMVINYTK